MIIGFFRNTNKIKKYNAINSKIKLIHDYYT